MQVDTGSFAALTDQVAAIVAEVADLPARWSSGMRSSTSSRTGPISEAGRASSAARPVPGLRVTCASRTEASRERPA